MSEVAARFDWDDRAAVRLADGRFLALLDGTWEELDRVSAADVSQTGAILPPETFAKTFPNADASAIPASPEDRTASA
ncbi:MAG: hypothetical protein OXE86_11210 [Alphaproteobacteria bacterium]|nr:hypothetical protein [Alphaproteobacteria bacterium]